MDANVEEREEEDDDEEGWSLRRRLEMTPPRLRDSCIKFLIFFRSSNEMNQMITERERES